MTEKKTFKNVACVTGDLNNRRVQILAGSAEENRWLPDPFEYDPSEWDLEITLTKKPKQFQPGDKVNFINEDEARWYPSGLTVLVQHKEQLVVVDPADVIDVYDADLFKIQD